MTERDGSGKFIKGNRASPGRPKRPTEKEYLEATIAAVSLTDWKKIVGKAKDLALGGDYQARRWLSDYLIGRPPQILELRGVEAQTLAQVLEAFKAQGINPTEVFEAMLASLTPTDPDTGGDDDPDQEHE